MPEFATIFFIKFKVVIYSFMAAYVAATMRYFKQKRQNKKPNFNGWFAFGATSFLVTFAFFSTTEYLAIEAPENMKLAVGFWVGYMADFFYGWIPKFLKTKLPNNDKNSEDFNDNNSDDNFSNFSNNNN